jgi:DNA (cytosine-5)-methyltransferase 1
MSLTLGSLFSGIGGLELGLERALGARTLWQVEQDRWCQQVLARHWPQARRLDDVCSVGKETLDPVDIICGGFPCQDLSYAGRGAGLAGERSGLWREYARIVRELRPRVVVVENVAALLARGLGDVLGDLAALGYDAAWDCVPAAAIGAPHRRDRLFVVAWRSVADADDAGPQGYGRPVGIQYSQGRRTARRHSASRRAADDGRHGAAQPGVGRIPDGLPARLDGAFGRGIARVRGSHPWPAGTWPTPCASLHNDGEPPESWLARREMLAAKHGNNGAGIPLAVAAKPGTMWPARPQEAQHAWEPPRTARGVPDRAKRLKALGNAVVPQVAEAVGYVVAEILEALDARQEVA